MTQPSISGQSGPGAGPAAKDKAADESPRGGEGKWPPHLLQATGFRPSAAAAPARKSGNRFWLHGLVIAIAAGAGWASSGLWMQKSGSGPAVAAKVSEAQLLAREENNTLTRVLNDLRILQAAYANVQGQVANLPPKSDIERLSAENASLRKQLSQLSRQSEANDKDHAAKLRALTERLMMERKSGEAALAALAVRIAKLEKAASDATPVASINSSQVARSEPPKEPSAAARPPRAFGYVLRDVYRGSALIETRRGDVMEVVPGMRIPGAGRIQSIVRRGGKWVVVTSNGVIDSQPY